MKTCFVKSKNTIMPFLLFTCYIYKCIYCLAGRRVNFLLSVCITAFIKTYCANSKTAGTPVHAPPA
ncbi:hypothetical protein C7N43_16610 [Sphingobacteriales bacterium UPWRP_1]|nr:hypothetical protein BVG80_05440 [Sphingobacteriales bacterium TSM_CSM]PSJ75900.1 hypothetical protein C7N43_16610 [Sphingobacteriales bacterium UPWRP_1]